MPLEVKTSFFLSIVLVSLVLPTTGDGQAGRSFRAEAYAGSEQERYLRLLQIAGVERRTAPWSLRPLAMTQFGVPVAGGEAHPWSRRIDEEEALSTDLYLLPFEVRSHYNSAFPLEDNNGAVWLGRGLTVAGSAGAVWRYGPLTVVAAPLFFLSQNAEFEIEEGSGQRGRQFAPGLDRPRRFGDAPYWRMDAGQSSARIDVPWISVGLSNANGVWGPANRYPLILGTNAPGFAHFFVETPGPVRIGIGSVHGRLQYGRLEQSPHSPMPEGSVRMMAGAAGVFLPAGIPGLEVGLARFYHQEWPEAGDWMGSLAVPFESIFKLNLDPQQRARSDNQLASVFARWAFPGSGLEVYGEYAREDHNADLRDFFLQPDHISAYTLGVQKVWPGDGNSWWVMQGEVMNAARPYLVRLRYHGYFYAHHQFRQGHTHRGQVLGSPAAIGGGAAALRVDRFDRGGRWTARFAREVQGDPLSVAWNGTEYPEPLDVIYSVGAERLLFQGFFEVTGGLGFDYNLDRYYEGDQVNLNASLGLRYVLGRWPLVSPLEVP